MYWLPSKIHTNFGHYRTQLFDWLKNIYDNFDRAHVDRIFRRLWETRFFKEKG